jgi:hypothetical protein
MKNHPDVEAFIKALDNKNASFEATKEPTEAHSTSAA